MSYNPYAMKYMTSNEMWEYVRAAKARRDAGPNTSPTTITSIDKGMNPIPHNLKTGDVVHISDCKPITVTNDQAGGLVLGEPVDVPMPEISTDADCQYTVTVITPTCFMIEPSEPEENHSRLPVTTISSVSTSIDER